MSAQQQLRSGRPFWLGRSRLHGKRYSHLSGDHQASVAIVGGGMTGALIAHAFASAGISTILLEASEVGRGSTAASSALLLQEPDLELMELANRYGKRAARRIWQMSRESVRALILTLRRLRIACDLTSRDAIYYAIDVRAETRLHAEYDLRLSSGFDATWLGPAALRESTGIAGRGAIRTHGSAQFDPYRACLGVLREAAACGARLFERSEVRRIATGRGGVRLWTRHGTVESERVSSRPATRLPAFGRSPGAFECTAHTPLRLGQSAFSNAASSVCRTS